MSTRYRLLIAAAVLSPLLLAPLLGIGPRPAALDRLQTAARLSLENGEPGAAAGHISGVIAHQPWREGLWETAGRSALAAGDFENALRYFSTAREAGLLTPDGYLALGDAYRGQEEWELAVEAWLAALNQGAEPVSGLNRLLNAYQQAGDFTAAISALQLLTDIDPGNAIAQYQLGVMMAAREPQAALAAGEQPGAGPRDRRSGLRFRQRRARVGRRW